jgi:hypothetical protein
VVIHDRVRSASGPHRYHWQLFPPYEGELVVEEAGARVTGERAALQVTVASPARPEMLVKTGPILAGEYADYPERPLPHRRALQVINRQPATAADFIVVLAPFGPDVEPAQAKAMAGEGWQGVQVERDSVTDTFYFATNGAFTGDEVATDGPAVFARYEGDRLIAAAVEGAKELVVGGEKLISADAPVHAAMIRDGKAEKWAFKSEVPAHVTIHTPAGGGQEIELEAGRQTEMSL